MTLSCDQKEESLESLWKRLEKDFGFKLAEQERSMILQMAIRKFNEMKVDFPNIFGVCFQKNRVAFRYKLFASFIPAVKYLRERNEFEN